MKEVVEVGKLREGRFIIIDGEPCRIVGYSTSAPGKHGHAKAKIDAISFFDGQKRTVIKPTSAKVEVPIVKRGNAQVLAVVKNNAQLMDLTTYETFELPIPMELRGEIKEGVEVEYIEALGRRKIERVK
ncbi:MAG: translation initiation factor IF-5A [Hadesarchaea archaeon]|jgi:translation initiation factor 5A|nr:translation initiation factor IF-5A [Hadesarchaea archaeon]TDA30661.1 MAG: translation initiation factor IF-5A [Hadesarchaea archaeon]